MGQPPRDRQEVASEDIAARARAELDQAGTSSGSERVGVLESLLARLETELEIDETRPARR